MVIRGKARGNGKQLGSYLMRKGENESVQILDIRGTSQPNNIHKSLLEMSLTSELSRTDKGLYHAQICPAYGEDKTMTREDWLRAADIVENTLGLKGQKRVIVIHEKNDKLHAHVVWERYDHEKGIMIENSHDWYKEKSARAIIEKELGHKRTPERNLKRDDIKEELTQIWNSSKSGQDFMKKAKEKGYTLAVGKDRPYLVIDPSGRSFNLVKQIKGAKTAEVGQHLKGQKLPTEKDALKIAAAQRKMEREEQEERARLERIRREQEAARRREQSKQGRSR